MEPPFVLIPLSVYLALCIIPASPGPARVRRDATGGLPGLRTWVHPPSGGRARPLSGRARSRRARDLALRPPPLRALAPTRNPRLRPDHRRPDRCWTRRPEASRGAVPRPGLGRTSVPGLPQAHGRCPLRPEGGAGAGGQDRLVSRRGRARGRARTAGRLTLGFPAHSRPLGSEPHCDAWASSWLSGRLGLPFLQMGSPTGRFAGCDGTE